MSYGVHTTVPLTEISLFASETEENFEPEMLDTALPEGKGELKSPSKQYAFSCKPNATTFKHLQKCTQTFAKHITTQFGKLAKPIELCATPFTSRPQTPSQKITTSNRPSEQHKSETLTKNPEQIVKRENQPAQMTHSRQESVVKERGRSLESSTNNRQQQTTALNERQWKLEETRKWWEMRYHQKERQGGGNKENRDQNPEKEEKHLRITKSVGLSSKSRFPTQMQNGEAPAKIRKPELAPPKIGAFALYYILTKMGIASDGASNFAYKKEIEFVDAETTHTHKKRLDDVKEALKKEKETQRWGVAVKVFSWIASLFGVISGIFMIATGVGAVAGAMLVAGGLIQLGNEIMEITGGWQKIAELLPGEDSEKKRAVISWMQIGVAVLCLVLSGAGILWGGVSHFGKAMQMASGLVTGVVAMGRGITTIGEGISGFFFKNRIGDVRAFDRKLAELKHMRQDLMDKVEWGMDRLEKLFEDLAMALEFEVELFQADQMLYR